MVPSPRRLALLAGIWFLLILATAYFARAAVDALRSRGWLTGSFWLLVVAVGAALGVLTYQQTRSGAASPDGAGVFAQLPWRGLVIAGVYVSVFAAVPRIEERLHLFQFGVLAVLVEAALRGSRSTGLSGRWRPALLAALITAAAGLVDELVQGTIPGRYYDNRDVVLNAASGLLALFAAALWRRGR